MSILAVVQSQLLQTLFKELDVGSLQDGAEVGARVVSTTSDGKATLDIGGKQVTANFQNTPFLAETLVPGRLIGLKVDTSQGEPRLVLNDRAPAAGGSPRQTVATIVGEGGSAKLGAAVEAGETRARPALEVLAYLEPEIAAKAEAILNAPNPRAVLLQSAINAVLSQRGVGTVLADVEALLKPSLRGTPQPAAFGGETAPEVRLLPAPLFKAAASLFTNQLDGEAPIAPEDIRQSLKQSGLFLEAKLARGEVPTPDSDLKAALASLKRAAERFLSTTALNDQGETPEPRPDPLSRADALPREATATPRRDAAPRPQPAAESVISHDLSTREAVAIVGQHAGEAIERIKLQQFGSLPPSPDNPVARGGPRADAPVWLFDVPIRLRGETSVAGFRIEEDREARSGSHQKIWRINFAVDTAELGPVHGSIGLRGSEIAVSLIAERAETADAFRKGAPALRDTLGAGNFEITDLSILTGKPKATPLQTGYLIDGAA